MIYTAKEIQEWGFFIVKDGGKLPPARPYVKYGLSRLRASWGVLIGKYDALDWEN